MSETFRVDVGADYRIFTLKESIIEIEYPNFEKADSGFIKMKRVHPDVKNHIEQKGNKVIMSFQTEVIANNTYYEMKKDYRNSGMKVT